MKLIITALLLILSVNVFAQTQGALENPSQDSFTSGIYMFSGWACEAELIEIVINGGSGLKAAYGTDRGDTRGICGDSDNGFGLLFNMSNLGTGEHTAVAFADGREIGRSTFFVQRLSTGEFLRGAESLVIANNFPVVPSESFLLWTQSAQNYAIALEQPAIDPLTVAGIWINETAGDFCSVTTERKFFDRSEVYVICTPAFQDGDALSIGYEGYIRGVRAEVFSALPSGIDIRASIRFLDPVNAILEIESCSTTTPDLYCSVFAGQELSLSKFIGANTGRAAVQDGTPLTPIGDLLEAGSMRQ